MSTDTKVQFVCFETTLDKDPFIKRWQEYTHSANSNVDVTLQQGKKNGMFSYIAQHRFVSGELLFVFSKKPRASRLAQVQIITTQAGGYSLLQAEWLQNAMSNEHKIFVFLSDPRANIDAYRQLPVPNKLNIYEAYFENCKYAYILEYFVKIKDEKALFEQLNLHDTPADGIYKECILAKNPKENKEKGSYAWPTF